METETGHCPNCGGSKVIIGHVASMSESQSICFVPPGTRPLRWKSGVDLPGRSQYCLSCGHLWMSLAPEALREFLGKHGTALANDYLDAIIAGPEHDVPDEPEARAAARKVAEIDALIVLDKQPEATRRYRELTGTTWDQAIDTVRHWRDRSRIEKLALFGWRPIGKPEPEESPVRGHPLHDRELDG